MGTSKLESYVFGVSNTTPKRAVSPSVIGQSNNGVTTTEKHSKTLGPSSTLGPRTSHSIHKDMIPIPSKSTSTRTHGLAEGQQTQGQQVAFASAWPNPSRGATALQGTENPG